MPRPPADTTDATRVAEASRRATYAYVGEFFDALARCGVDSVVVSPGSRSTPLTVTAARTPGLRVVPIVDERSAGFFALGLARQSGRPVALVCTSGTAATNYLPAVTEGHYARIPLIVLTADRPPELREWGAGQTIDQVGLYGGAARRFVEVPVPGEGPALLRHARVLAARAVGDASGSPPGPVHLNWPFREPLEPPTAGLEPAKDVAGAKSTHEPAPVRVTGSLAMPPAEDVAALAAIIRDHRRGVIDCGSMPPSTQRDAALAELARRAAWPILADPLSGLRRGRHVAGAPVVAHSDLWLRDAAVGRSHAPDAVLRFGDSPTSKALRLWLEASPPSELILVDPDGGWADPSHLATRVLRADPALLARALCDALGDSRDDRSWVDRFVASDQRAGDALGAHQGKGDGLDEPGVVHVLGSRLPTDATLWLSSSMPVRDADAFLPLSERPLRVLANRGANGIDGVTSSALGAAFADRGPVVLLTGDLALLHDIGGLLAARSERIPLVIVVLNNDGGGIFSFLPIAGRGDAAEFERLFRTPHGIDLERVAALYDVGFDRVASLAGLGDVLDSLLSGPLERTHLVEVPIDRDANSTRFRALARHAAEAVARGTGS